MELFRGDSFLKKIKVENYQFKSGDILHIAILKNAYCEEYLYEQVIEIEDEANEVILEIPTEKTKELPIGKLLLEIELTYTGDLVKTNQYDLEVKADGINE